MVIACGDRSHDKEKENTLVYVTCKWWKENTILLCFIVSGVALAKNKHQQTHTHTTTKNKQTNKNNNKQNRKRGLKLYWNDREKF